MPLDRGLPEYPVHGSLHVQFVQNLTPSPTDEM